MKGTMSGLFGRVRANRTERASVLVFALSAIGIIAVLTGSILYAAVDQRRLSDRYLRYNQEFSVAEFQLTKAFGEIGYALKKAGETDAQAVVDSIAPASVAGYEIDPDHPFRIDLLSDSSGEIPEGEQWSGYNLRRLTYRIYSGRVRRTDGTSQRFPHPGVDIRQDLQITYIPLYIFGIFYDNELEIHPGADFEENGRVHTNSHLFYGADGRRSDFRNFVSAAGNLNYGRHPNAPQNDNPGLQRGLNQGTNRFWDGAQLVNTRYNGTNLDWRYNQSGQTWADVATSLWNGYVKDRAMGVARFSLPWPEAIPTIEIIQPPSQEDFGPLLTNKFYYKSGLRIVRENGETRAVNLYGDPVELTFQEGSETRSVVSTSTFYNERVGGTVNVLDVDLAALGQSGITPPNGIVYVNNTDTNGAVRIINGSDLPGSESLGFSFVTPDPLYVQGDYNTEYSGADAPPSMLAADAINILSQGWSDTDNNTAAKRNNTPNASGNLTMNAVVVAGNVPTTRDNNNRKRYSGGVENFFRYLEKWNGSVEHVFSGSIINLFPSLRSIGQWDMQKYSPPRRVWSWDRALARRGPPGSPNSFHTVRLGWSIYPEQD